MNEPGGETRRGIPMSPIERRVRNDFFWSFQHSQGDPVLQTYLTIYTAKRMNREEVGSLAELSEKGQASASFMKVPKPHVERISLGSGKDVPLDDDFAQNSELGFQARWRKYIGILNRVLYNRPEPRGRRGFTEDEEELYEASRLPQNHLLARIADHIIFSDLKHQSKPRENREGTQRDPHESQLRTYGLEGISAQTPDYDALYQDVKTLLTTLGFLTSTDTISFEELKRRAARLKIRNEDNLIDHLQTNFYRLQRGWEEKHPGQKFIPEESL